jgi:hypothetical protein
MTGMAGHDPGISGHVRPESLVTLLRNTQNTGLGAGDELMLSSDTANSIELKGVAEQDLEGYKIEAA